MKKLALICAILLPIPTISMASSSAPTKQDFKDFYGLMKVLYSNMPALMTGFEIMVDADFQIEKIEDKSKICDFIHAAETISYVSQNAKVHPEFADSVESLKQVIKPENAVSIKKALQRYNYPCI